MEIVANIFVFLIIVGLVLGGAIYILHSKRKGQVCIGCPNGSSCCKCGNHSKKCKR